MYVAVVATNSSIARSVYNYEKYADALVIWADDAKLRGDGFVKLHVMLSANNAPLRIHSVGASAGMDAIELYAVQPSEQPNKIKQCALIGRVPYAEALSAAEAGGSISTEGYMFQATISFKKGGNLGSPGADDIVAYAVNGLRVSLLEPSLPSSSSSAASAFQMHAMAIGKLDEFLSDNCFGGANISGFSRLICPLVAACAKANGRAVTALSTPAPPANQRENLDSYKYLPSTSSSSSFKNSAASSSPSARQTAGEDADEGSLKNYVNTVLAPRQPAAFSSNNPASLEAQLDVVGLQLMREWQGNNFKIPSSWSMMEGVLLHRFARAVETKYRESKVLSDIPYLKPASSCFNSRDEQLDAERGLEALYTTRTGAIHPDVADYMDGEGFYQSVKNKIKSAVGSAQKKITSIVSSAHKKPQEPKQYILTEVPAGQFKSGSSSAPNLSVEEHTKLWHEDVFEFQTAAKAYARGGGGAHAAPVHLGGHQRVSIPVRNAGSGTVVISVGSRKVYVPGGNARSNRTGRQPRPTDSIYLSSGEIFSRVKNIVSRGIKKIGHGLGRSSDPYEASPPTEQEVAAAANAYRDVYITPTGKSSAKDSKKIFENRLGSLSIDRLKSLEAYMQHIAYEFHHSDIQNISAGGDIPLASLLREVRTARENRGRQTDFAPGATKAGGGPGSRRNPFEAPLEEEDPTAADVLCRAYVSGCDSVTDEECRIGVRLLMGISPLAFRTFFANALRVAGYHDLADALPGHIKEVLMSGLASRVAAEKCDRHAYHEFAGVYMTTQPSKTFKDFITSVYFVPPSNTIVYAPPEDQIDLVWEAFHCVDLEEKRRYVDSHMAATTFENVQANINHSGFVTMRSGDVIAYADLPIGHALEPGDIERENGTRLAHHDPAVSTIYPNIPLYGKLPVRPPASGNRRSPKTGAKSVTSQFDTLRMPPRK